MRLDVGGIRLGSALIKTGDKIEHAIFVFYSVE